MQDAEIVLRRGESLVGSLAKPLHSLAVILSDTPSRREYDSKIVPRIDQSLVGGFAKPLDSLCGVLRDALSGIKHGA